MAGVWSGLGGSAFLAGLGEKDRAPLRLIGAVAGGLVAAVVAAVAAWCLIMVAFTLISGQGAAGLVGMGRAAEALVDPAQTGLAVTVARLAVTSLVDGGFLLVFAAFAAAVGREPLHRSITSAPRVRWMLLLIGLGLAAVALIPIIVAERVFGGETTLPVLAISPSWGGRALYAACSLLLIPAAAAEELVFRGWLLRRVAAFAPPSAILVILTAILFAAAHFDFNPDAFLTRVLMGAGFAYMTLRLGGIEFSSGVHAANNMLIVLFLEPLNLQAEHPALSAFSLLEDITLLIGYFLITEAVVHIPQLRRWAGVRREELSPPDNKTMDSAILPARYAEEYTLSELIGLAAISPDGAALGRITGVESLCAADFLEIQPSDGSPSWWSPLTREAVPEVRIAAGEIVVVRLPEMSQDV